MALDSMVKDKSIPEELRVALKRCDLLVGKDTLDYFYELYDNLDYYRI